MLMFYVSSQPPVETPQLLGLQQLIFLLLVAVQVVCDQPVVVVVLRLRQVIAVVIPIVDLKVDRVVLVLEGGAAAVVVVVVG